MHLTELASKYNFTVYVSYAKDFFDNDATAGGEQCTYFCTQEYQKQLNRCIMTDKEISMGRSLDNKGKNIVIVVRESQQTRQAAKGMLSSVLGRG